MKAGRAGGCRSVAPASQSDRGNEPSAVKRRQVLLLDRVSNFVHQALADRPLRLDAFRELSRSHRGVLLNQRRRDAETWGVVDVFSQMRQLGAIGGGSS
jgi:hypothetical protein